MPRAILRSSISFGLVSIPVELFPATSSKSVHFNLLHAKDNSRIQEKIYCLAEDKRIDRNELVHGFQISKGKCVSFTGEELKKLEAGASREIEIVQFVPFATVDPVYFAASYLLTPSSGSNKAYHLFYAALKKSARAAIARLVMRGKEHLALIRPYDDSLMLHTMHYADEIRSAKELPHAGKASVKATELHLAERLIDDLSKSSFTAEQFEDTYRKRILKVAKQKAAGEEIEAPEAPRAVRSADLMTALKKSLEACTTDVSAGGDHSGTHRHRSERRASTRGRTGRSSKRPRRQPEARS
jgi:DNA end-binding protein Ku